MYIEPNTTVKLLKNCPLDTTYEHTVYFDSTTAQANYFSGLTKYTLSKQTYQRVNKGVMRVAYKADDIYDCNYLMFQNENFGSKWFYAFIKSVEYVNNVTSEIEYEIDVMQTWFFDYTLGQCFVVREHSATDVIGENLVPENLEQGDYIENDVDQITFPNVSVVPRIVIATTFNNDDELTNASGRYINGVYSGINFISFSSLADVNEFLDKVTEQNKIDGIVSMYMCPWDAFATAGYSYGTVTVPKYQNTLNGYSPKNKKLLTYPYNVMHVTGQSVSADFHYELFGGDCTFNIFETTVPEPTATIIPYKYLSSVGEQRYDQRLTITNFPQCAYNNDVYKAYIAYNATSIPTKMISEGASGVLSTVSNVLTGNVGGAVSSALNTATSIAQDVAQLHDISTRPPQANGTQTSSADFVIGATNVYARHLTIRAEFARIIDDYFTMFGYATHRVKIPNRNVRPYWTYTHTRGCVIHGSVPCDDMNKICHIYNNGITFWNNGANVGNYSLNNSV